MENIHLKIEKELLCDIEEKMSFFNTRNDFYNNEGAVLTVEMFIYDAIKTRLVEIDFIRSLNVDPNQNAIIKNNFKKICKKDGIAQSQIVEITGIPNSTISSIFTNRSQPNLDHFIKIWEAINLPPLNECFYKEEK
ncbi:helix-turn-helix domain-containing protein [Bacillus sp. Marseille-P3800]|uniref:helix-turn-helix domain-containing protein n=1 Tax=Bacillus sp. Marseille-P3800 TaxID=2014782 RepID=UPI000C085EE2|nr:helix-turn-helix transcriptional regulator [Bacillus sp. Marseille-P3800]